MWRAAAAAGWRARAVRLDAVVAQRTSALNTRSAAHAIPISEMRTLIHRGGKQPVVPCEE